MNNSISIIEIGKWLSSYIFYRGFIPAICMVYIAMYIFGMMKYKKIKQKEGAEQFSIDKFEFSPAYEVFKTTNNVLDVVLSKIMIVGKQIYQTVDSFIPDSAIIKVFKMLGADTSMKKRVEVAHQEFDTKNCAFLWNKMRAPDFQNISPVISGKWFNGKPVEKYLSLLIAPRTIYACFKLGIIVSIISFIFFSLVYQPQITLGYLGSQTKTVLAKEVADRIFADPSIIPQFRKDVWSKAESDSIKSQAFELAPTFAMDLIDNAKGYNYHMFGFIFTNGLMFDIFISLALGILFFRKAYYYSYKLLKVPYIKDSHEIYGYEKKSAKIDIYRTSIAAANTRATNYDRSSPLSRSFVSTGTLEKKGQIGAKRKGEVIYQSIVDKSQNTLVIGAIGTGKSELCAKPEVRSIFELKNSFLKFQKRYEEIYDTRVNALTDKAIKSGYLDKYCPLPYNPYVIAMMIFDVKAQLLKDMKPIAEEMFLGDEFLIIGADSKNGEHSFDPLAGIDPTKAIALLDSVMSQMGGKIEKDFWQGTAKEVVKKMQDVAYLFSRCDTGIKYMTENQMKIWSLMFVYNLVSSDSNSELLAHAIHSIYTTANEYPEKLADALNLERVQSISYLLNDWQRMPEETKGGIKANMNFIMNGLNSDKLAPFLTGFASIEVGEFWKYIVAVNLPTDKYQLPGKMITLMGKTLVYEEAVKRQINFSRRVLEISSYFIKEYPELLVMDSSVELLPVGRFENDESTELLNQFNDLVLEVRNSLMKNDEVVVWEAGSYTHNLKLLINKEFGEPSIDVESIRILAKQALDIGDRIRRNEPALSRTLLGVVDLDPAIFNKHDSDTEDQRIRKQNHLRLYYEFQDAKTRMSREHMYIIGDEWQELTTIDTSGACYADNSFFNVNRSTKTFVYLLTQTVDAFILKIGKEATNNIMNQMRNKIYLASEDKNAREEVRELAGKEDVFHSKENDKPLKNGKKDTGYTIYGNYNGFVSEHIEINKAALKNNQPISSSSPYPYTYDILAVAEPIEVDVSNISFDGIFSNIFNRKAEFEIPSMKRHFLNDSDILELEVKGSDSQGKSSNADALHGDWKQAYKAMEEKYESYLKEGFVAQADLISESDYTKQSNAHAVISVQRAGMTVLDHVLIAPDSYIQAED